MMEIEPSPALLRAHEMIEDPDKYFAEARRRAAEQVRAERAATLESRRAAVAAKRAADRARRAFAHAVRAARVARRHALAARAAAARAAVEESADVVDLTDRRAS